MKGSFVLLLVCIHGFCWSQSFMDTAFFAQKQYKSKNYVGALSSYESARKMQITEKDTRNLNEIAIELGQAAYKTGDYKRAIENFEKALKNEAKKESRGAFYYNLGNASYMLGNTQKAIEYYKQGIKASPEDLQMKYNLSQVLRKKAAQKKQSNEQGQQTENVKSDLSAGSEKNTKPSKYSFEEQQKQKLLNDLLRNAANTKRRLEKKKNTPSPKAKDW